MVQYTFKWQKRTDNEEVYVTGTFDNWTKSVKLEQDAKDEKFLSATTELKADEKILYKFVVNDEWITDSNASSESDASGIQNNVLYPEQILAASTMSAPEGKVLPLTETPSNEEKVTTLPHTEAAPTSDVFIQSAAPQATTVGLAAQVPFEKLTETPQEEKVTTLPHTEAAPTSDVFIQSAAPQSTTVGLAAAVPLEAKPEETAKKAQIDEEKNTPGFVGQASEFLTNTVPQSTTATLAGLVEKVETTVHTAQEKAKNAEGGFLGQANEFISHTLGSANLNLGGGDSQSPTPDVSGGPGGFPQTPAAEKLFSVNPLPASKGPENPVTLKPGEEVPKFGAESVNDNVKLDEASYKASDDTSFGTGSVGINPLPASKTAENPITLNAGEEVPKFNTESINDNVKLDEQSYKATDDTSFGTATIGINPFPASQTAENPVTLKPGEPIPDEFKPGAVGTQSITANVTLDEESYKKSDSSNLGVGPAAFTLPHVVTPAEERAREGRSIIPGVDAYFKPTETKSDVPAVVQDSIKQSDWAPEGTANKEAVAEKKEVESELIKTVQENVKPPAAIGVPPVVAQSLAEFNTSPEAAANALAVEEKKDVEKQLLEKVASSDSSKVAPGVPDVVQESLEKAGKPAEAAASPDAVKAKEQVESALVAEIPKKTNETGVAADVPEVVKDSLAKAHASPEAAAAAPVVEAKAELESQLLKEGESTKDGLKNVQTKESSTLPAGELNGTAAAAAANGTNGHAASNGNGATKPASAASAASSNARKSTSSKRSGEGSKSDSDKKKEKRSSKWFHKLTSVFKSSH